MSWVSRLPRWIQSSPWKPGENHLLTYLQRADAEMLGCWWYDARGQQWLEDNYLMAVAGSEMSHFKRRVVVFLHGRGSHRGRRWLQQEYEKISIYMQAALVIIDYRGFADSMGEPSEEGLIQDALMAIESAVKDLHATEVVVWGQSLGSGVATQAVARYNKSLEKMDADRNPVRVSTLVLEAPFTCIAEGFADHWLYRPLRWVVGGNQMVRLIDQLLPNDQWYTEKHIRSINCRLVLIHGDKDATIPHHHSERLNWTRCQDDDTNTTLFILPGATHNSIARHARFKHILKGIVICSDHPDGMPLQAQVASSIHIEAMGENCSCGSEMAKAMDFHSKLRT